MGNGNIDYFFRYEGRVTKGKLTLNISNIQMGNADLWANTYKLPEVVNGVKKIFQLVTLGEMNIHGRRLMAKY